MPEDNPLQGLGPAIFPPGTVLGEAERRARLAKSLEHVVEITAILAAATKVIPGPAGKIIGGALAGLVKDPQTGKVRPGEFAAGNFLPSPFGFLDPTTIGLKRNFYLPEGSTEFVPRIVDQIGVGLPEQREIDERRERRDIDNRRASLQATLAGTPDDVLADLVDRRGGLSRAGVIFAQSLLPADDVVAQARAEQLRRASPIQVATPAQVTAQLDPLLNPDGTPGPEIIRFVYQAAEELSVDAVTSAAQAVDRLFAANPPDP